MPAPVRPLRACIDARVDAGEGGIVQVLIGLAHALSRLADGDEEYLFLVTPGQEEWLLPYVGGRCRLLRGHPPAHHRLQWLRTALGPPPFPDSDGTIERAGVDVMHFVLISGAGFRTRVPSLFTPHDLPFVHRPGDFAPRKLRELERNYRTLADQARAVISLTRWGREDLIQNLGLLPEKVHVVPWAPSLALYHEITASDLAMVRRRYDLPQRFMIYPVQTYPHKNHLRLLQALATLRDRDGLVIPLITPGNPRSYFYPVIAQRVQELHLEDQVRFVGVVTPLELHCFYRLSTLMVYPSLFDGFGMPLGEAMYAGLPIACSTATCLPDVVGDAALLFAPHATEAMAAAMARLWTDERLRQELAVRGRRRAELLTWDRVARQHRALYRLTGDRPLTPEDSALLHSASPLRPSSQALAEGNGPDWTTPLGSP